MQKSIIISKLDKYIEKTRANSKKIKIALVASVQNKTNSFNDFKLNSIITTYLSLEDCNELIEAMHQNGLYVSLYTDIYDLLKDICTNNYKCNIIFETSPKGIAKGKDCLLPSLCDTLGLKHIGPDAGSNYKCVNKYYWYCILKQHKIPVPETFLFDKKWITIPKNKKYIIKLNEECASIGLSKDSIFYNNLNEMTAYIKNLNMSYQEPIIAQEFISGYEVEVPVLINDEDIIILPAIGLSNKNGKYLDNDFFDYNEIFDDNYGVYLFEEVEKKFAEEIYKIVEQVVSILTLRGYFRIDFRVSKEKGPFVIDINNDPTLNSEGSYQKSITSLGYSKKDVISIIVGNYLTNKSNTECL